MTELAFENGEDERYAIYAEATDGHDRPLLQFDLSFAGLMDDVVVPYKSGSPFSIDGVLLSATSLKRIKVLRLSTGFNQARTNFNQALTRSSATVARLIGDQYAVRVEHMLRHHGEDVTSQVIKAFDQAIQPRLKDYLPQRNELISAALELFKAALKTPAS